MSAGFIIVILAIGVVMYFILIRPQRARQKHQRDLIAQVGPGDEIVTIGGLYGDVVEIDSEGEKIVVEIAEDVHIEIARRAIASVVKAEDLVDLENDDVGDGELVQKYDPDDVRSYAGVDADEPDAPERRVLDDRGHDRSGAEESERAR